MKHPETEYCTGCEAEVNRLKAAVILLLVRHGDRGVTVPQWLNDLSSVRKLTIKHEDGGTTFEIAAPNNMGS